MTDQSIGKITVEMGADTSEMEAAFERLKQQLREIAELAEQAKKSLSGVRLPDQ